MDTLKELRNRGYVIAGIAGIVGFIAFFLPYASALGYSVSGSTDGGILWFEFLAALVTIAVSAVLIYRPNAFGVKDMPLDKQIRYGIYAIIGAGAVGLLVELIALSNITSFGVSLGIGWWLYLFSAIAMIVGGVMALRNPQTVASNAWQYPNIQYPQNQPYPPQSYPSQPTPYPPGYPMADQSQYPPYPDPVQYPPTDPHTGSPQQYPPQQYPQQQYPPQQYPPA